MRAIQAMPVEELQLPLWNIAKAKGRVLQHVKRPPRDRKELETYLRIADDFTESHGYEMLSSTTIHYLAANVIPWAWDQVAHGKLLVLSNAVGTYFPQAVEVPTTLSSASSRAVPAPIGRQPIKPWEPVHSPQMQKTQEEISTTVGRFGGRAGKGEVTNQRIGRQPLQRAPEVATFLIRQSSPPSSCTKTSKPKEDLDDTEGSGKKEGSEETEGTEDSYYIPNDYYSDESRYHSDMFKKCWEDDF
jgi:hypothetical protein